MNTSNQELNEKDINMDWKNEVIKRQMRRDLIAVVVGIWAIAAGAALMMWGNSDITCVSSLAFILFGVLAVVWGAHDDYNGWDI